MSEIDPTNASAGSDNHNDVTVDPILSSNNNDDNDDNDTLQCYICWEGGSEQHPIVRDCSCRGTMGFVHVACLIQSVTTNTSGNSPIVLLHQWNKCPHCQQPYNKDPTKSALQVAVWGTSRAQQWNRLQRIIQSLTKQLMVYVAVILFRSLSIQAMEQGLEHAVLPSLQRTMTQAVMDYKDGQFWSVSILNMALLGLAFMGLIVYYREDIKLFLRRMAQFLFRFLVLFWAGGVAGLLGATLTGWDASIFITAYFFVCLSYLTYLHWGRDEIRQRGRWVTLVNWTIVIAAVVLSLLIEEYLKELWRNRYGSIHGGDTFHNVGEEFEVAMQRFREKRAAEQRFDSHVQSLREDYWWCCA